MPCFNYNYSFYLVNYQLNGSYEFNILKDTVLIVASLLTKPWLMYPFIHNPKEILRKLLLS